MNDSRIFKSMHYEVPVLIENTEKWFERICDDPTRHDVVFEDENGELLAMGGLTGISENQAELYVFVNPDRLGQGLGRSAVDLLCRTGFETLCLNQIHLYTNKSNIAAQSIYRKCGFKLQNVLEFAIEVNGELEDRLFYVLRKSEVSSVLILDEIKFDGRRIKIVRDDLYPVVGGGNKSRKAQYYEREMMDGGYNACVTTGGIQSNHNRAIALMCARNGWRCHNVYHGTEERFLEENGNALLVRKSGSTFEFVEADNIGPAMDAAMVRLAKEGYKPMYIHGGGHDLPGGIAFVNAVKALKDKCDAIGYKPEYVFHASGTGSTQAGLAVGLDMVGWTDVKLVGISVARKKQRGTEVIEKFANTLSDYYALGNDYSGKIDFNTDYLCGGYENYTQEMAVFLDEVMKATGIMFDTTYSGKAFYGMIDFLNKNHISGNVLFWHTGGLMNLMK